MYKNVFVLSFLSLFIVSCSGSDTNVNNDTTSTDCSLAGNSEKTECKKEDKPAEDKPLTEAEKKALNDERIAMAKVRGNFFYSDADDKTQTWLESGATDAEKLKPATDLIYFTLKDESLKKAFLFSKEETKYEGFRKIKTENNYLSSISPVISDTDEHVSQTYVGGKYIGVAVVNDSSPSPSTYNIYHIEYGYFFIPLVSDHAFGFFNRGKANDFEKKLFEPSDLQSVTYEGDAWGQADSTRIEGDFTLNITANALDVGNKMTFTFPTTEQQGSFFTNIEITNLNFTEPDTTLDEKNVNPYFTGYFVSTLNPDTKAIAEADSIGTLANNAKVLLTGKTNGSCTEQNFVGAAEACAHSLTLAFAGEDSFDKVGGHLVYDFAASKGIYFAGVKKKTE